MIYNDKGNLSPIGKIRITYKEFVDFYGNSQNLDRIVLLGRFTSVVDALMKHTNNPFQIWIGGSFLTNKTVPGDIDMKCFLSIEDYNNMLELINYLQPNSDETGLDIGFKNFTTDTKDPYNLSSLQAYENLYSSERNNPLEIPTKGFIVLEFND